jgi:hypothetical protein
MERSIANSTVRQRSAWTGFAAMCAAALLVPSGAAGAEDQRDAITSLKDAYTRNRQSFTAVDCEFTWRRGIAESLPDALAGMISTSLPAQHGRWVVDGQNEMYELRCDPELNQQVGQAKRNFAERGIKTSTGWLIPVPCAESYYLKSEAYSLSYGSLTLAANLFPKPELDPGGIRVTPFNLDIMGGNEASSPTRYLDDCLNGRFESSVAGMQPIDGNEYLIVSLGPGLRMTYGFDPQRGHLLAYYSASDANTGEKLFEMHVTDARACAGGRWFPTRTVLVSNPNPGAPFDVRELQVVKLDVDSPPAPDAFQLDLAAGTQVNLPNHAGQLTNLNEAQSVGLADLPVLHARCLEWEQRYLAAERWRAAIPVLIVLGAVAIAAVGLRLVRRYWLPMIRWSTR